MSEICSFNVYPNITITKKVVKGILRVSEYIPFVKANVAVMLFDENDKIIDNRFYIIDGDDFLNWGNDDKYLVNLIKNKLNAT
jgi:hypothetical protein